MSQLRASCAEKKSRCDLEVGKEAGVQAGVALEPSSHVPSMRCLPPFTLETCQSPSAHPTSWCAGYSRSLGTPMPRVCLELQSQTLVLATVWCVTKNLWFFPFLHSWSQLDIYLTLGFKLGVWPVKLEGQTWVAFLLVGKRFWDQGLKWSLVQAEGRPYNRIYQVTKSMRCVTG